jgi:type 1 glutamine amidotransferase
MRSNLILTGGINHDFVDTAHAIADVLADAQFRSTVIDDLSEGFELLASTKFDLITLFALRWRMLDDDKYIPDRARWAYEISERDRHTLAKHVANGGGLLGLHTAAICFDTWPEWPELLGAAWVWRQTFHPPPAELLVRVVGDHALTRGLKDFLVVDELYHNLWSSPTSIPLLFADSAEDGSKQQIAFASATSTGRVVYNALGHDRDSVTTEGHAKFLQRAANWCTLT